MLINHVKTRVCSELRLRSCIIEYLCNPHVVTLIETQIFFRPLGRFSNSVAAVVIPQRPDRAHSVCVRFCFVLRKNTNSRESRVLSFCQTQLYGLSSRREEHFLARSMLFLFVLIFCPFNRAAFL